MEVILLGVYLFIIIFFAVRLAIKPIIPKEQRPISENDVSIIDLRDLGVFDNDEIDEILALFQYKGIEKKNNTKMQKYIDILKQLNNFGYLNDDQLHEKIGYLKRIIENNNH